MKSLSCHLCLVMAFGLFNGTSVFAQSTHAFPQPDDTPEAKSVADVITEFDVDKNRALDQQELENVLSLLFLQIRELRQEVQSLKEQVRKNQSPPRHTARKVPLPEKLKGPAEGGVYAGKWYGRNGK